MTSASVIITATIAVPANTTAAAVQSTVFSNLGTTAAASTALGITVEAVPTITVSGGGEGGCDGGGCDGGGDDGGGGGGGGGGGAIIGGAAGGGGALLLVVVGIYCMKKRGKNLTTVSVEKGGTPAIKGDTATRKAATISPLPSTYSVELTKTPLGLGLSLTDDVVTEIKSDSQVARDGRIKVGFRKADPNPDPDPNRSPNPNQVGDRVVAVNGEAPTTANPSSTILQTAGTGTVVKLKFTSEQKAVSAVTEVGQNSSVSVDPSVSVSPSKARPLPPAVLAHDSQKMRRAAELLESWKLLPSELIYGDKVGAGGQADVYLGRWQVIP